MLPAWSWESGVHISSSFYVQHTQWLNLLTLFEVLVCVLRGHIKINDCLRPRCIAGDKRYLSGGSSLIISKKSVPTEWTGLKFVYYEIRCGGMCGPEVSRPL